MRGSSGRQNITRVVLAPDPERPDGLVARSSGGQDSYMLASLAALALLPWLLKPLLRRLQASGGA